MFISTLELFKIGVGPSSSHTVGPMLAAIDFRERVSEYFSEIPKIDTSLAFNIHCSLKGSLAFTGKGHATDRAVVLGLHGYSPQAVVNENIDDLIDELWGKSEIELNACLSLNKKNEGSNDVESLLPAEMLSTGIKDTYKINFDPANNVIFDHNHTLDAHPNGMVFQLSDTSDKTLISETYFSIGGGFIVRESELSAQPNQSISLDIATCPYAFDSAYSMLVMSRKNNLSIAEMKRLNELARISESDLFSGLNEIWSAMRTCIGRGLRADGELPGGLNLPRRAKMLHQQLRNSPEEANLNDWLCVYAMAINEENAAGHMVVTAPTNGAAGVIPAVLYYFIEHEQGKAEQVAEFLLVAAAIGGLIKHRSSISGAEVGCQGEVGSAAAMAAAGLCSVRGGTTQQIENAAEIALEHHLGLTCDPVNGLVQVPCIERNGFGAIKAYTAASLAIRGTGQHFISLDNCIAAMKQTGQEMSSKYKETSQGGLAVNFTEC